MEVEETTQGGRGMIGQSRIELSIAALCLMKGGQAVEAMGDRLDTSLFQDKSCKAVVEWVVERSDKGKFVDLSTIEGKVAEDVALVVQCGALDSADAVSLAHIDHLLSQLEKESRRRRLNAMADMIKDRVVEEEDLEALEEKVIEELASGLTADRGDVMSCEEAVILSITSIEEKMSTANGILGFPLGFKKLNKMTQGAQKGDLWVLAGRPGHCKSLLAGVFARNVVVHGGGRSHIISMEMQAHQWTDRLIQSYSHVNISEAIVSKEPAQLAKLKDAANKVATLDLSISDRPNMTKSALYRMIRAEARKGANFFVIDHLALLKLNHRELRQEMKEVSGMLKSLAKKLSVNIVLLIQLNRRAEEEMLNGQAPALRHLAESDGPGADCDVCLMLDLNKDIHIVKNRNGCVGGVIETDFVGKWTQITEAVETQPPASSRQTTQPSNVSHPTFPL